MAGYLLVPNKRVPTEFNGGFSLHARAWPLLEDYPGRRFQTGLFGTWMFPVYDPPVSRPLKEGVYTDIEGGLGWWRDTRFATSTPKFIMGGVALNFVEWANGPGAGKGRDWENPKGKYAVVQLSPHVLWPPDGLNLKQGTAGGWFGYGYLPLPMTDVTLTTKESEFPTGNQCWTLFLASENFKGPVAYFAPHFWTRHATERPELAGKLLDAAPANPNRALQMETQYIPSYQAKDKTGKLFAKVAPTRFPTAQNGTTELVHRITSYRKQAFWDRVVEWFAGGQPADSEIDPRNFVTHEFTGDGGASWSLFTAGTKREEKIRIDWRAFATPTRTAKDTFAYTWNRDWVTDVEVDGVSLVQLPQYYRLDGEGKRARWVPVKASEVPEETELADKDFPAFQRPPTEAYETPKNKIWTEPGPVSGPHVAKLGDGSTVTYAWYRFSDQPAIIHAGYSQQQRSELQRRAELIHRHWTPDREYLPSAEGSYASLDPAVLVTPPPGLEIGYVPIVLRQGE
ncbi:MAG TPA: hypothetical protein DDW52_29035 [Planctomycetaceae bacterium]|nr:hypothetical protein [Planctomycetaceae bacterium]